MEPGTVCKIASSALKEVEAVDRGRGKVVVVLALAVLGMNHSVRAQGSWMVTSPDSQAVITVRLTATGDKPPLSYDVEYTGKAVLGASPLGIARKDQAFVDGFKLVEAGRVKTIDETYTMMTGKRRLCRNHANERTFVFENSGGAKLELIVRAYNDGVAFRYRFPEQSGEKHTVTSELTGFGLPQGGKMWAHPYDKPSKYTPAYETYYVNGAAVGTPSNSESGWAFPVLFCTGDRSRWALLTEAGLDSSYCGCRLTQKATNGAYRIRFPDEGEGNYIGAVEPSWTLPWATPWRVIIVGDSVGDIVESTLVTDVSPASVVKDTSWIKPGRASWSWLFDHDSPQDCTKLKTWVDLAAARGWEYSLVDANWSQMKNGTIHDLLAYAKSKGVGLLFWYNSGGPHNFVSEKPRGLMDHREIRREEFRLLKKWGVKGVKVDFFQSDKQNIIQLYHEILQDAAEAQIMVNFHGCTLPRGWSRTYPHLTTYSHELALSVVFESGWLHFADGVKPYLDLPEAPKTFLQHVPVAWDETRFLAGEPGQYVVLARRSGNQWYLGGLNGENAGRDIDMALSFLGQSRCTMTVIEDGKAARTFDNETKAVTSQDHLEVRLLPYGGFVAILTPTTR